MSWKSEREALLREQTRPPEGYQSVDQIAAEMEVSRERAAEVIKELVKKGRAEAVQGRKLTALGVVMKEFYYRLVPAKKKT
jgi:Fic family protein